MKLPFALILAGVAVTVTLPAHVSANPGNEPTVVIHNVEFRGSPPFQRNVERVEIVDVALFAPTDKGEEGARKFRTRGAGLKRY